MREIKFRCWNVENKEMLGVQKLAYDINLIDKNPMIRTEMYSDYFDEDEMKLMQYTGLKDKNGKEIYEGDIVEYADQYKYIICYGEHNINPTHCAEAIIVGYYLKSIKSKVMPKEQIEHLYSIDGIGARFPKHCALVEEEKAINIFKLEVIRKHI